MGIWTLTETEVLVQRLESAEAGVAILSTMWTREEGCGPTGLCCRFVGREPCCGVGAVSLPAGR